MRRTANHFDDSVDAARGRSRWLLVLLVVLLALLVSSGSSSAQTDQREVRVAVRVLEPFVIESTEGSYTGFSIDLWETIAKRNGYRTTYVEVGSVNELLDEVRSGRADVAITAISITAEREQTVDFSKPMFNAGLQIAIPSVDSRQTGGVWSALASPTVLLIVIAMLVSILVAAIIVWLIERRDNPDFAHSGVKGIFEGVWWAVVTMLTVGYGDRVTRTPAGRAFSMLFMVFGVLLVATFTATFTATLTLKSLETDIERVSDLRGKQVVTIGGTTSAAYLEGQGIAFEEVDSVEEMTRRIEQNEADAAVYDSPVLTYQVKTGHAIHLVGAPFTREYYAIAEAPSSDLGEAIDFALLTAYQDGTYVRLYDLWFGTP